MIKNSKIRISVVSYLNSRPFIYGLRNTVFNFETDIQEDIPSVCADKLINGEADIGLVPIAVLPLIKEYSIISDYCIGADGEVSSVLLLSEVPLNEIDNILLDYQSRTSILLTRILAKKLWKINPQWKNTNASYENQIKGSTAGVVIGDRALKLKSNYKFVYDLSAEWKKLTSLPFVFACWVCTKKIDDLFIADFNKALAYGIQNIDRVVEDEKSFHLSKEELKNYLTKNIDYNFDEKKKEAMNLFLGLRHES